MGTLPSFPNAISLQMIANVFGGSTPHAISEYYGKAAGIPASGTIRFSDFHGKSAGPPGDYVFHIAGDMLSGADNTPLNIWNGYTLSTYGNGSSLPTLRTNETYKYVRFSNFGWNLGPTPNQYSGNLLTFRATHISIALICLVRLHNPSPTTEPIFATPLIEIAVVSNLTNTFHYLKVTFGPRFFPNNPFQGNYAVVISGMPLFQWVIITARLINIGNPPVANLVINLNPLDSNSATSGSTPGVSVWVETADNYINRKYNSPNKDFGNVDIRECFFYNGYNANIFDQAITYIRNKYNFTFSPIPGQVLLYDPVDTICTSIASASSGTQSRFFATGLSTAIFDYFQSSLVANRGYGVKFRINNVIVNVIGVQANNQNFLTDMTFTDATNNFNAINPKTIWIQSM
jgi:hypothetical protein